MTQIDMDTFQSLREAMGADFTKELIVTYTVDTPVLISQLRSAIVDSDSKVFSRAAHSIKSNAAIFGAMQLSALAEKLEVMGRENNLDVKGMIDELETTYLQIADQLKTLT